MEMPPVLPVVTRLTPYYPVIDQTGLEAQLSYEGWLWKFEGISTSGYQGGRFTALTAGFEYTQVGIFDSWYDLGWLVEYQFDDRGEEAAVTLNGSQNWFGGLRFAFNDMDSSEILFGIIWDPHSDEKAVFIEFSKRLSNDWKLAVEAGMFESSGDPLLQDADFRLALAENDDYVQIELTRFF